jgi:hypothetical protein
MKAVIDLTGVGVGKHTIVIKEEDITHPPYLKLVEISPKEIKIRIEVKP